MAKELKINTRPDVRKVGHIYEYLTSNGESVPSASYLIQRAVDLASEILEKNGYEKPSAHRATGRMNKILTKNRRLDYRTLWNTHIFKVFLSTVLKDYAQQTDDEW